MSNQRKEVRKGGGEGVSAGRVEGGGAPLAWWGRGESRREC